MKKLHKLTIKNRSRRKNKNVKGGEPNNVTSVENVPYKYTIVVGRDRHGNEILSNVIGTYTGFWRYDKPFRKGTFVLKNNIAIYNGPWENGLPNGYYGEYILQSGNKYFGQFKDGHMDGEGTFLFHNGDKYVGQFKNSSKNGNGVLNFSNGDIYEGEFTNGTMGVNGVLKYAHGDKYTGQFNNNNKINGYGVLEYVNGDRYEGQWVNNKKNGVGTFTKNNETYTGIWNNNEFTSGQINFRTGVILVGDFNIIVDEMGRRVYETNGTAHYPDGSRFTGIFINYTRYNGTVTPEGVQTLANNSLYSIRYGFENKDPLSITDTEFL
jgi:hypothetical protein